MDCFRFQIRMCGTSLIDVNDLVAKFALSDTEPNRKDIAFLAKPDFRSPHTNNLVGCITKESEQIPHADLRAGLSRPLHSLHSEFQKIRAVQPGADSEDVRPDRGFRYVQAVCDFLDRKTFS
jgi:hypothetical protein